MGMLLLSIIPFSTATTLQVGPSRSYTTISSAFAAASNGDTILVDPGTYTETLDLRNKDLTVSSTAGAGLTTLITTSPVQIDDSTFSGFTISPAPQQAIIVSGDAQISEVQILDPSSYGVVIGAGTAVVDSVWVRGAGLHAFIVTGGSATFRHCVADHPLQVGFALQSSTASAVWNSVSIGGQIGVRSQVSSVTFNDSVVVGSSRAAIYAASAVSSSNSVFEDNSNVAECASATVTLSNGVAWANNTAKNCDAATLTRVTTSDPLFSAWNTTAILYDQDFSPGAGSPLIDRGSGTDPDGSAADYGIFGGSYGDWPDVDNDGVPVLFDCDDHLAATHTGAVEIADGHDNDCNGLIDDGVVIDTGGGDSPGDSPGDSEPIDPSTVDLDGDGYTADIDCDEHNIATHPTAVEIPDFADNDCDTLVDEGTAYGDDDGDFFSETQGDCDDTDPGRYPGANDAQTDGVDHDCDGQADMTSGRDRDADGYNDDQMDCNDTDAAVHPGAADVTNGIDDDCDGSVDEDGRGSDGDRDTWTIFAGDCNDAQATIYPGATDIPDDFIDQDCNGTDNYDLDRDGDAAPASGGKDCDDVNSTISSHGTETCGDGLDQDCDGSDASCDSGASVKNPSDSCGGCNSGVGVLWLGLGALGLLRRKAAV